MQGKLIQLDVISPLGQKVVARINMLGSHLIGSPKFQFFWLGLVFQIAHVSFQMSSLDRCQRVCVGRNVQVKENDGSIRCHMVTHQVLGSHLQQPAVGQESKIPPRIAHKNATQLQCNLHHITRQVPTYH